MRIGAIPISRIASPRHPGSVIEFVADKASISMSVTLNAGAPTPLWTVREADGAVYTYTTAAITHNRTAAGPMRVTLDRRVYPWVTHLAAFGCGLTGDWHISRLRVLPAVKDVQLYTNASLRCLGALADLPSTMTHLHLGSTSSVITGALADLPSTMTYLALYGTSSVITGGATAMAARGALDIRLYSTGRNTAQVDEILARIYADRALFTTAVTRVLQVGGTNAAPTGTYAANCPTAATGKEMAYHLVNDPCTEGHKLWTVTFTA